jgi:hypothetical protein
MLCRVAASDSVLLPFLCAARRFFTPTLAALTACGAAVHVLCLSNGACVRVAHHERVQLLPCFVQRA